MKEKEKRKGREGEIRRVMTDFMSFLFRCISYIQHLIAPYLYFLGVYVYCLLFLLTFCSFFPCKFGDCHLWAYRWGTENAFLQRDIHLFPQGIRDYPPLELIAVSFRALSSGWKPWIHCPCLWEPKTPIPDGQSS